MEIKDILKLTQEELLDYCYLALIERGYDDNAIDYTKDYLFAEGSLPVLLVAHCDIVHRKVPEIIVEDKEQGILWSPTGIGGDDRCGVFALLKICEMFQPSVLFTTDEERGCIGAKKFADDYESIGVKFIIEIDRRGDGQVVYYRCGNEDFMKFIEGFGFERETGSNSDVNVLSTKFDVAGCNLSAGYYREHTDEEHIYMAHLWHTIRKVKQILSLGDELECYDCQEKTYTYGYNYGGYSYEKDYEWTKDGWYDKKTQKLYASWEAMNTARKQKEEEEKKKQEKEEQEKLLEVLGVQDEEDFRQYYEQCKKRREIEEETDKVIGLNSVREILEIEDDYYSMAEEEFKQKYGVEKPKNVVDIYDIQDKIDKEKENLKLITK